MVKMVSVQYSLMYCKGACGLEMLLKCRLDLSTLVDRESLVLIACLKRTESGTGGTALA